MKRLLRFFLILTAITSLPLRAADGELVVVKSSSIENKVILLDVGLSGKETTFECLVDSPQCFAVQPGEYVMVRADAEEATYNDCANVVLYKSSPKSGTKEKMGVYCWLNSDCYMIDCAAVNVQTISANVPDKIMGESNVGICKQQSRPDCRQAVAFFEEFQKAVLENRRTAVASMLRFPLRVNRQGKKSLFKNKSQLISQYDVVFDSSVRCAIAKAKKSDIWGNWQGYTVGRGIAWWERSNSPGSLFKVITVNDAVYEGCGKPKC